MLPRAQSPTHGAAGAASSSVPLEELAEKPGTGMLGCVTGTVLTPGEPEGE